MSAVTNSTGEYLLMHAEIETEGARVPPPQFDAAVDEVLCTLQVGPDNTAAAIARLCAWFSTPEREVTAHTRSVNGRAVTYFVREPRVQGLDALLRPGSPQPLTREPSRFSRFLRK